MVPYNILKTRNSDLDLGSGYDSGLPTATGHLTTLEGVSRGVRGEQGFKGLYRGVKVFT